MTEHPQTPYVPTQFFDALEKTTLDFLRDAVTVEHLWECKGRANTIHELRKLWKKDNSEAEKRLAAWVSQQSPPPPKH